MVSSLALASLPILYNYTNHPVLYREGGVKFGVRRTNRLMALMRHSHDNVRVY